MILKTLTTHGGSLRYYIKKKNNKKIKINRSVDKQIKNEIKFKLNRFNAYKNFAKSAIKLKKKLNKYILLN